MATPSPKKLPWSEKDPPDLTLYVKIPLGGGTGEMTGIFFSQTYKSALPLNIVLYLRGNTNAIGIPTIDKFFKLPQFLLREEVNRSGKNIIFVAPTLGGSCQAGSLNTNPDSYLDKVIENFKLDDVTNHFKSKNLGEKQIHSLILAAHSSGGNVMFRVMRNLQRYKDKIKEIWGFDCLDKGTLTQHIVDWAKEHHDVRLYYYYNTFRKVTAESTVELEKCAEKSGILNRQFSKNFITPFFSNKSDSRPVYIPWSFGNIFIYPTLIGHDNIPTNFLATRIKEAALTD